MPASPTSDWNGKTVAARNATANRPRNSNRCAMQKRLLRPLEGRRGGELRLGPLDQERILVILPDGEQRLKADRYLLSPDTEEAADVEHGADHPARGVDQQVVDGAHLLLVWPVHRSAEVLGHEQGVARLLLDVESACARRT